MHDPRSRCYLRLAVLAASLASALGAMAAAPGTNDGDWPMSGRDFAGTRFSPLTDITAANVGTLKPAFTFSTGVLRGHEAAPIVVNGTMYIVTP